MADLERDRALSGSRLAGGTPRCTPTPMLERLPSETPLSSLVVECRPQVTPRGGHSHVCTTRWLAQPGQAPPQALQQPWASPFPAMHGNASSSQDAFSPVSPQCPAQTWGHAVNTCGREAAALTLTARDQDSSYATTFPGPC